MKMRSGTKPLSEKRKIGFIFFNVMFSACYVLGEAMMSQQWASDYFA